MDINYYLISPTGNITVLVTNEVDIKNQPEYAMELLRIERTAQQVGYVTENTDQADIGLRMAAGEFCGNATMSTAALYCKNRCIKPGETAVVKVDTSGVDEPVNVTIECMQNGYRGTLQMPSPKSIQTVTLEYEDVKYELPIVDFGGISHIIIERDININPEKTIVDWCEKLNLESLGLIFVNEENGKTYMNPLVYVSELRSCYWESSCGSGTTALGAYLYYKNGLNIDLDINEPGGVMNIKMDENGPVLTGSVIFEKEVTYYDWK